MNENTEKPLSLDSSTPEAQAPPPPAPGPAAGSAPPAKGFFGSRQLSMRNRMGGKFRLICDQATDKDNQKIGVTGSSANLGWHFMGAKPTFPQFWCAVSVRLHGRLHDSRDAGPAMDQPRDLDRATR